MPLDDPDTLDLSRMRADAERLATLRAALDACHDEHAAPRWRVAYYENSPVDNLPSVWSIENDAEHRRDRYDLLEDPPEVAVRWIVEARNTPLEGHVLALMAELERLRAAVAVLTVAADVAEQFLGDVAAYGLARLDKEYIRGLLGEALAMAREATPKAKGEKSMKPDPRQITDLSALAGKTVARATFINGWDELAVVFTDGTFLYVDIEYNYDDGELTIFETAEFDAMQEMGIATEAEIEADRIAREREAAEDAATRERREREEFERLKAKFDETL